MCNFVYQITVLKSEKITTAQTNEATGNYTLTDMRLEYELIESEQLGKDRTIVGVRLRDVIKNITVE